MIGLVSLVFERGVATGSDAGFDYDPSAPSFLDSLIGSSWVVPDDGSGAGSGGGADWGIFNSFLGDFDMLKDFIFNTLSQIYEVVSNNPYLMLSLIIVLLGMIVGIFRLFSRSKGSPLSNS